MAERLLLPGDPGQALALAQSLLQQPRMFNHHLGLWGYTGAAADGEPLTIQSTGIGGPSAAIVLSELIELGARRAVRLGACAALAPGLELGELIVARECICADGTSRALAGEPRIAAERSLTETLARSAPTARAGTVLSVDVVDPGNRSWQAQDALAVERETAALFAVGAGAEVPVACLLAVSETFGAGGGGERLDDHSLQAAAERMGVAAAAALGA
jgi:uridine phosphorylase